ncbi:DedA family protein [Pokkaliibacter sp. CJK22405]|uniref:DedA family protein n=1 Tax=Pokkaliibacter sp. CJK22405 TaxID=3384615 RepID=UPI00398486F9
MDWQHWVATYGYYAVAVGTLLEGETVLLLAGVAVSHGILKFDYVLLTAIFCSFVGDQSWFSLGRYAGISYFSRWPSAHARIEKMRGLIHRYHAPLIIVNRFLYGLRSIGPALFGTTSLPQWKFACFNLLGALLWSWLILLVGIGAHQLWQSVGHWVIPVIASVLVLLFIVWKWRRVR